MLRKGKNDAPALFNEYDPADPNPSSRMYIPSEPTFVADAETPLWAQPQLFNSTNDTLKDQFQQSHVKTQHCRTSHGPCGHDWPMGPSACRRGHTFTMEQRNKFYAAFYGVAIQQLDDDRYIIVDSMFSCTRQEACKISGIAVQPCPENVPPFLQAFFKAPRECCLYAWVSYAEPESTLEWTEPRYYIRTMNGIQLDMQPRPPTAFSPSCAISEIQHDGKKMNK